MLIHMSDNFLQLMCLLSGSVLPFFSCSSLATSQKTYGCHGILNSSLPLDMFFHHSSEVMPIMWPCLRVVIAKSCCSHLALGSWVESTRRMTKWADGKSLMIYTTNYTASGAQLASGFPVVGHNTCSGL